MMDMRTAIRPYGRPEMAITNVMTAQLARHLGASFAGHGGLSDAKRPSVEAGAQKALTAIPTLLAGGHLWLDAGLLAIDEVCSPIQMVLDNEFISVLKHLVRPFAVDEEAVGLDTISGVRTWRQFPRQCAHGGPFPWGALGTRRLVAADAAALAGVRWEPRCRQGTRVDQECRAEGPRASGYGGVPPEGPSPGYREGPASIGSLRCPTRPYDVVTISDSCVDLLLYGNVVPRFGQVEQLVDDYLLEMGGSCAIFACQAARLGLKVGILGRVGEDDFGRLVLRRLQDCGVDIRHMIVDPSLKTGVGVALCKENDRAILTYMGSICAVTPEDVTDDFLASSRHLHHGSFFLQTRLMDAMPDIFRRARRLGLSTSLDTNWDPREEWNSTLPDLFPLTDIFMPNEQEAMLISRRDSVESALDWFRQAGVPLVVLKQGERGPASVPGRRPCICRWFP